MFKLSADFWTGVRCDEEEIEEPTWAQAEQAIRRLDATRHTSVTLTHNDGSHICAGGGGGRFVVYVGPAHSEEEGYFTLANPAKPPEDHEELVTGGQLGVFPAQTVVDLASTLKAVRTFLETRQKDAELSWIDE